MMIIVMFFPQIMLRVAELSVIYDKIDRKENAGFVMMIIIMISRVSFHETAIFGFSPLLCSVLCIQSGSTKV